MSPVRALPSPRCCEVEPRLGVEPSAPTLGGPREHPARGVRIDPTPLRGGEKVLWCLRHDSNVHTTP